MKQPVPKMTALPKACTICDLWMKRGLIPRSHAGIKGFMISFKAYGQYDPLSYRKKQDQLRMNVAPNRTITLGLQIVLDHRSLRLKSLRVHICLS